MNHRSAPAARSILPGTAALALFFLLLGGGCGGDSVRPTADKGQALQILQQALDAWKAGNAKDLARAQPPVRLTDPDEAAGAQLDDYKIDGDPKVIGPVTDVPVEISLTDARKQKRTGIKTVYQVATSPGLVVLRNDP
jgi:hypothetical protein